MIRKTMKDNLKIFDVDAHAVLSEYNAIISKNELRGYVFLNTVDAIEKIFNGMSTVKIAEIMSVSKYRDLDMFVKVNDDGSLTSGDDLKGLTTIRCLVEASSNAEKRIRDEKRKNYSKK